MQRMPLTLKARVTITKIVPFAKHVKKTISVATENTEFTEGRRAEPVSLAGLCALCGNFILLSS